MENNKPKNSEKRIASNNKWTRENYEQISLAIPKGTKLYYKVESEKLGYTSLNKFIKDAIQEKIERGK